MSDEIIFKEDLEKRKSMFGWLPFAKKTPAAPVAPIVADIVSGSLGTPAEIPKTAYPGESLSKQSHASALSSQYDVRPQMDPRWEIPVSSLPPLTRAETGAPLGQGSMSTKPAEPVADSLPKPMTAPVAAPAAIPAAQQIPVSTQNPQSFAPTPQSRNETAPLGQGSGGATPMPATSYLEPMPAVVPEPIVSAPVIPEPAITTAVVPEPVPLAPIVPESVPEVQIVPEPVIPPATPEPVMTVPSIPEPVVEVPIVPDPAVVFEPVVDSEPIIEPPIMPEPVAIPMPTPEPVVETSTVPEPTSSPLSHEDVTLARLTDVGVSGGAPFTPSPQPRSGAAPLGQGSGGTKPAEPVAVDLGSGESMVATSYPSSPMPKVTFDEEPEHDEPVQWGGAESLGKLPETPVAQAIVTPPEKKSFGSFFPWNKGDAEGKPKAKPSGPQMSEADLLYQKGVATLKDLIAPPAIRLTPNTMQVGEVASRTLFIIAYPKYLGTNWFSPIVNLDAPMDIAFFIHPIDTRDIVKDLRRSATQVQSQIGLEAEDGKIRDPMLEAALQNIEELRDKLQQGTEKFFRFGLYMSIYAADEKGLDEISSSIEAILEAQLVFTKPAVLRMDQGFVSTRPLAMDTLDIANNLNTAPLSTTFPFVSSDLSSNDGVLYGINRHNNSLILFDRFKMENANMVVFAKSGAGKSYTVKLEVLRAMMFNTSVIIIDPENEYKHLCETVDGSFLNISLNSESHLNPFDLPKLPKGGDADDDLGMFRSHIANVIGLLHLMLGSVTPEEDSVLDRAIRETYAIRDITENSDFRALTPSSYPTMTDLHAVLKNLEGAESLSARLERYTDGVFGGFLNHQTNISMDKQLVVFNIRDLENELRPIAMYIVLQFIWNEIRAKMKQRLIVVDEAWIMMQNEDAAAFLFGIAKRCRKYYTGLTTITQDIGDFMSSRYGKPIVTNSSMQMLLKQSPASIELIAETFYLTDHEKFLLLESNVGEGIFFAGTKHVAIKVIASYSEDQIITTDPRQLMEVEQAKKDFDEGR